MENEKIQKDSPEEEEQQPMLLVENKLKNVQFQKFDQGKTKELNNPCPRQKASYLSQMVYFWAEPFVWRGYKNPLTTSDLWDLDANLTSNGLVPKFDANLNPLIGKRHALKKYDQFTLNTRSHPNRLLH